jgi:hypothetical protein
MIDSRNLNYRLQIASPCPVGWEQMRGDDRVRFCEHCELNVYNFSELDHGEIETLISKSEGRVCARLYRRSDGTVLTRDCPEGLKALRRRMSKRATAVFAALIAFCTSALSQKSSTSNTQEECRQQTKIKRSKIDQQSPSSIISGVLLDQNGAVIPGAHISVRSQNTGNLHQTTSDQEGRFNFVGLTPELVFLTIEQLGFENYELKSLSLEPNQATELEVTLVATAHALVGILELPVLIDKPFGTTIISGDTIRRLPLP